MSSIFSKGQPWIISVVLVVCSAAVPHISELTVAPSFGSTVRDIYKYGAEILFFNLGFLFKSALPIADEMAVTLLGVWIFYIPVIQSYILPYNTALGPVTGSYLHGALGCYSILYLSGSTLQGIQEKIGRHTGLAACLGLFAPLDLWMRHHFHRLLAYLPTQTPVHLQLALAAICIALNGKRYRGLVLLAIPAILHTATLNPHYSNTHVNRILTHHNWTLLDRSWSETGYISVLESHDKGYRVMRADHSLLGGEWLLTPERVQQQGWKTTEPIYAVFQLLEAVRLLETDTPVPDPAASALVIGLGIGTTPRALMAHGIRTTIVELDSAVHRFARSHFGLPADHTFIHADAVSWASTTALSPLSPDQQQTCCFDYIVHDVFTGGAEPLPLFTHSFLTHLRARLRPDGVIAVNYAGELGRPLTNLVLRTVVDVFEGQCKAFRDSPAPAPPSRSFTKGDSGSGQDSGGDDDEEEANADFVNLVIFCRNSPGPIAFRRPTEADFLGSLSRRSYLYPPPEQEVALPPHIPEGTEGVDNGETWLFAADVDKWRAQQAESARRHWKIMRDLLEPAIVWDLW